MSGEDLQESPLRKEHEVAGGRMVPFSGWRLPVQYQGILQEHDAVRRGVGVFDISHMGQVLVRGEHGAAEQWLDRLLTNRVAKLKPGEGQYTLMLNEEGGVLDDLIVYREAEGDSYFLVINAA
ncbi:MAG: glycine cleavage system protein T, partial [Verrucomicrobiota bacterium]